MAHGNQKRKRPSADEGLASEQFGALNRQFYGGRLEPHEYLRHRWRGLAIVAQPPDVMPCVWDTEFTIDDLKGKFGLPAEWDAVEVRDYVSTEAVVLFHHSAESLLRLYFGHVDSPECPWIGVAKLRGRGEFQSRIQRFIRENAAGDTRQSLMEVFHGRTTAPVGYEEHWQDLGNGLILIMSHVARRLVEEAPLYNSAKHGLSIAPGAAEIRLGDPDSERMVGAAGPSITHLKTVNMSGRRRWVQETVWLDSSLTLALTNDLLSLIGNLWHCARCRYAGTQFDPRKIQEISEKRASAVISRNFEEGESFRISVPSVSTTLRYETPE